MIRHAAFLSPFALAALVACSTNQQGAAPVLAEDARERPAVIPAPTASAALVAPPGTAVASAAPAPPPPVEASAAPAVQDAPAVEAALPAVKVANIGMHIGGGPNDDVTKDPIRRSVQPHFDAFRRCFAHVEEAGKVGDFGVDLRIDRAGGKAQVSHPRTALKGKQFKECVVHTFEEIDFLKPKGGTTTVSYSLRFTPARDGA